MESRRNARPIEEEKKKKARELLKKWRVEETFLQSREVHMGIDSGALSVGQRSHPAMSSASRTNTQDQSSSPGTSVTGTSTIWDATDGLERQESRRRELTPAMKARKAFFRYLGACPGNCRFRRVKCYSSHHALETLLDGNHTPADRDNVRWAFEFDWDSDREPFVQLIPPDETNQNLPQPSIELPPEELLRHTNNLFGLYPAANFYPGHLPDSDFSDLPAIEEGEEPIFDDETAIGIREETPRPAPFISNLSFSIDPPHFPHLFYFLNPFAMAYNTTSLGEFAVACYVFRNDRFYGRVMQHLQCLFIDGRSGPCQQTKTTIQSMLSHIQLDHNYEFNRLQDEFRLRCSNCNTFVERFTDNRKCSRTGCGRDLELCIYGGIIPYTNFPPVPPNRAAVPRSYRSNDPQYPGRSNQNGYANLQNGFNNNMYGGGPQNGNRYVHGGYNQTPGSQGYGSTQRGSSTQWPGPAGYHVRNLSFQEDIADSTSNLNLSYRFCRDLLMRNKLILLMLSVLITLVVGAEKRDWIHRHNGSLTVGQEWHPVLWASSAIFGFIALRFVLRSSWFMSLATVRRVSQWCNSPFKGSCTSHRSPHDRTA